MGRRRVYSNKVLRVLDTTPIGTLYSGSGSVIPPSGSSSGSSGGGDSEIPDTTPGLSQPAIMAVHALLNDGVHAYGYGGTVMKTDSLSGTPSWEYVTTGLPDFVHDFVTYSDMTDQIWDFKLDPFDTKRAVITGSFGVYYNDDWTAGNSWVEIVDDATLCAGVYNAADALYDANQYLPGWDCTGVTSSKWQPFQVAFSKKQDGTIYLGGYIQVVKITSYYGTPAITYSGPHLPLGGGWGNISGNDEDEWIWCSLTASRSDANKYIMITSNGNNRDLSTFYVDSSSEWLDETIVRDESIDAVLVSNVTPTWILDPPYNQSGVAKTSDEDYLINADDQTWLLDDFVDAPTAETDSNEAAYIITPNRDGGNYYSFGITNDWATHWYIRQTLEPRNNLVTFEYAALNGPYSSVNLPDVESDQGTRLGTGFKVIWSKVKMIDRSQIAEAFCLCTPDQREYNVDDETDPIIYYTDDTWSTSSDKSGDFWSVMPSLGVGERWKVGIINLCFLYVSDDD